MKKPTQETLVAHWNTAYRIGTPVRVREFDGTQTETKTSTPAYLVEGRTAVVVVEGISVAVELSHVAAILEPAPAR